MARVALSSSPAASAECLRSLEPTRTRRKCFCATAESGSLKSLAAPRVRITSPTGPLIERAGASRVTASGSVSQALWSPGVPFGEVLRPILPKDAQRR